MDLNWNTSKSLWKWLILDCFEFSCVGINHFFMQKLSKIESNCFWIVFRVFQFRLHGTSSFLFLYLSLSCSLSFPSHSLFLDWYMTFSSKRNQWNKLSVKEAGAQKTRKGARTLVNLWKTILEAAFWKFSSLTPQGHC